MDAAILDILRHIMGGGQAPSPDGMSHMGPAVPDTALAPPASGMGVMGAAPALGPGGLMKGLAGVAGLVPEVATSGVLPAISKLASRAHLPAEFMLPEEEGAYNAAHSIAKGVSQSPAEKAIARIMTNGSANSSKAPLTPFQRMSQAGAFSGQRSTGSFPEGPGGLSSITPEELANYFKSRR